MCTYRENITIFIRSIIRSLLHQAQLHVSAANAGHVQEVVYELIEQLCKMYNRYNICGVFLQVWGRYLCGTEISFVSVVGAWSGTVPLVYSYLISSYVQNGIHYIMSLVMHGIYVLSLGCQVYLLSFTFIFSPWKLWYGLYPIVQVQLILIVVYPNYMCSAINCCLSYFSNSQIEINVLKLTCILYQCLQWYFCFFHQRHQ